MEHQMDPGDVRNASKEAASEEPQGKLPYVEPLLRQYGELRDLSGSKSPEGKP